MFYMHLLVNKRGPLAKIWLAAHWEKKLTKAHIFECNLETTVEKIMSPKFTIALRTSGHLLLGVVRIYHRKAKYLLADCGEALTKMKTAFRPGLVDLPSENFEAAYQSITLPEEFNDFEAPLPDVNAIDVAEHFTLNQSRAEDITLIEDYETDILLCDRNFGERNVEPDALRKKSFFEGTTLTSSNSLVADRNDVSMNGDNPALSEETYSFKHDCFGDEEDAADMIEILLRSEQSGLDKDMLGLEEKRSLSEDPPEKSSAEANSADTTVRDVSHLMTEMVLVLGEEGFVLEPVDDTAVSQRKKNKRKRKLLVDAVKELSCHAIYNQLNNCSDTLTVLDLAPPTKKTMEWKKSGGVENLLSEAAQPVFHEDLQKLFAKCFKGRGFKMRRVGAWAEADMEETRKEHDTTVEDPSYLQDSVHSETERKMTNDLLMLMSQKHHNRDMKDPNAHSSFLENMRLTEVKTNDEKGCKGAVNKKSVPWVQDKHCSKGLPWEGTVFSESSSLGPAAEAPRAERTNVCVRGAGTTLHHMEEISAQKYSQDSNGIVIRKKDSEEIKWSKRTLQLLNALQHLKQSGVNSVPFRELCRENSRKEAAATFYILLVLKKQSVVELTQSTPFTDIIASAGPMFHAH
ncbi:RD21L protein, partial [Rhinopomastus cyanomelas]|nr:RD21L protein [Rhinopomastus cyanomelas]